VGKSTLFNALLKKQTAYVANFPFATIEPNIGVVPVPDDRLHELSKIYNSPEVPATIEFVDIAGLISGASKGEGLGNKFLSHIREVDAICNIIRLFRDPNIINGGSINPKSDFETIKTELELADLETIERRRTKKKSQDDDVLPLLMNKPMLVVLNVDEDQVARSPEIESKYAKELGIYISAVVAICAKTEAELTELLSEDQVVYLNELGQNRSGLERLIQKAFKTLGLMTFLTAGEKEVRAWTIKNGTRAQDAAGVIHSDFVKKFIKADVVGFDDFVSNSGWKKCRELGKVRSEGRDYIMQDGDVVEFKIGA
jgi:ribosome-binding ATPase YchF (GTP1/OBG family)